MFSLRCGVGLVNVFVIMVVASITLSITLTNTMSAINTNGRAHVLSILGTAEAAIGTTFDGVFSQLDALSDTLSEKDWAFPSNENGTTNSGYADWRDRLLQLYLTGPSHFILVYYSDNSLLYVEDDYTHKDLVAFDEIRTTSFPESYNLSSFTKGMTVSRTLTTVSSYFNRSDGTMVPPKFAPKTPNTVFNTNAFQGPTWLYDKLTGPASQLVNAKYLLGNYVVRHQQSAFLTVIGMSNFRRPMDSGSTYPFGMALAGITLDQLSAYLLGVLDSPDSLAFCIDGAGSIIAASTLSVTPFFTGPTRQPLSAATPLGCETSATLDQVVVHNDTFVACRKSLVDYNHPAAAAVGTDWVVSSTSARAKQIDAEGSSYFAAALQLQMRYTAVKLFLLLVIPESDVIGNVVQGRNIAIGVTCAAFVVVAALSFAMTSWLLKPLTRIAERMTMAARLEDDRGKESLSYMREVYDLQIAYYEMNEELNRVRSFVPQAVLQHDDAVIDDNSTCTPRSRRKSSNNLVPTSSSRRATVASPEVGHTPDSAAARRHSSSGKSNSDISRTRVVDLHCALNTNVVSVLTVNLSHFHREAFALPPKQVVAGLSDVVGVVTQEVTSRGGVLSLFHGDHFVVVFNGSRRCDRHARMALLAAVSIRSEMSNRQSSTAGPLRSRCPVRIGVATGTCLVGAVGNTTVKTFATIGPCVVQSNMLQRVVNQYGAGSSILTTKRAAIEAGDKFEIVYVDVVGLPTRTGLDAVPIAAVVAVGGSAEGLHVGRDDETEFLAAVRLRNRRIECGLSEEQQQQQQQQQPQPASRSTTGLYLDGSDKVSSDKNSSSQKTSSRCIDLTTSRSHEDRSHGSPSLVNVDDSFGLTGDTAASPHDPLMPSSGSVGSDGSPQKPLDPIERRIVGAEHQRSLAASIEAKWDIISRIEPLLDRNGCVITDAETKSMVSNSLGPFFNLCAM